MRNTISTSGPTSSNNSSSISSSCSPPTTPTPTAPSKTPTAIPHKAGPGRQNLSVSCFKSNDQDPTVNPPFRPQMGAQWKRP
jgi:hypothetical protein